MAIEKINTTQAPICSGFNSQTTAKEALGNRDLKGKIAIVTGGYSGIGNPKTTGLWLSDMPRAGCF
jgi:hypothetical protein